jgi:hypothetical protein
MQTSTKIQFTGLYPKIKYISSSKTFISHKHTHKHVNKHKMHNLIIVITAPDSHDRITLIAGKGSAAS